MSAVLDYEAGGVLPTTFHPGGHERPDTHGAVAAGVELNEPTSHPSGQTADDAQTSTAAGAQTADPANTHPTTSPSTPGRPLLVDGMLVAFADALDDMERTRVASENRLRQLTRTEEDSDGEERGFGLDADHPQVRSMQTVVDGLAALEHSTELALNRALKTHPLMPWVKARKGVGPKQFARLLASIGDPYWHGPLGRPRTVSELRAYCGYHVDNPGGHNSTDTHRANATGALTVHASTHAPTDAQSRLAAGVAPSRRKGQKANWNAVAKMRVWLIATSCIKQDGEFRAVYDEGRFRYCDSVHGAPCARCGPKGKPAEVGSPLSAGHQNARAIRLVCKEILRDLWLESRRLHELESTA